jgi:3',5'-cyclic AMP phosphodiesterase CpdA
MSNWKATTLCGAAAAILLALAGHTCLAAKGGSYTFIAYGDTRSDAVSHAAIVAEIVGLHPEFVLQSGDLVDHGTSQSEWAQFDSIESPIKAAHIAYYPARGNHDLGSYYLAHVTQKYDSGNGYYYAFTRHNSRFMIVDSFEDYDPTSAQYKWLESELQKANKSGLNTFVMFHESPFSVGPHGDTPEAQEYLHPLFAKYKVSLVICGHDHLYYRMKRDGVNYVVTGGGGAPLYPPDNAKDALPGDVYKSVHHVVELTVQGNTITGKAIAEDGSIIDTFTLTR